MWGIPYAVIMLLLRGEDVPLRSRAQGSQRDFRCRVQGLQLVYGLEFRVLCNKP